MLQIFQELNEKNGITLVMVTHEEDIALCCKRVLRFRDGRLISDERNKNPRRADPSVIPDPNDEEALDKVSAAVTANSQ